MRNFSEEDKEVMINLVNYITSKALIGAENIDSGFLTGEINNNLSKDAKLSYLLESQGIMIKIADNIANAYKDKEIDNAALSPIWQYVFDRAVEASYKLYSFPDEDIDTVYLLPEAFEFYKIDLPEYIQLKLTNVVRNVGFLFIQTMDHIRKEYIDKYPAELWLTAMFIALHQIAFAFALQLDLNDTSEMDRYLYGE